MLATYYLGQQVFPYRSAHFHRRPSSSISVLQKIYGPCIGYKNHLQAPHRRPMLNSMGSAACTPVLRLASELCVGRYGGCCAGGALLAVSDRRRPRAASLRVRTEH